MTDFSLQRKWALVTGASGGIGAVTALTLAHHGADLVLTGRRRTAGPNDLEVLADRIAAVGRQVHIVYGDLAQAEDVRQIAADALTACERVDVLVNMAGVVFPNPALQQTVDEWDLTMAVNLRAPFILSQALAPAMVDHGGGSIVMVGSAAGIVGLPERAAYAASKGGLIMLTRQLAVEWGQYGIRVNCVAPTVTLTPMAEEAWADPGRRAKMLDKIPLGKFAQPIDTANTIAFLASPAAGMINGAVLPVDGGFTIQ
jgi:NAD(P)-dependent dehydrogenase (short-subunit alcohol dehydrogenase family)